ncbi:hypothetical protein PBAL39_14014 [Pedobacter sp. BAL39]|uniref:hypothetical protein n=1 Tax=Pedobacter sp. BAL39 TaxID=391596 RepID=UPI000155AA0D|nr:hypothetical protein [Pedobacter sp. BAL39]EDM34678.1 hypothetical protein PBAL39_14014 [Pedobacter sp. BAL39]
MKISKELIEKYHRSECTPEEKDVVEDWLFADFSTEELVLPAGASKQQHKEEMWREIASILPEDTKQEENPAHWHLSFWTKGFAASLLLGLIGFTAFQLMSTPGAPATRQLSVNNSSAIDIRHVSSSGCNIAIAPNSYATINYQTGDISLSGSIVIRPKKNIAIVLKGTTEKMTLKAGETYVIFNDASGNDKIIVINEKQLSNLPPVIQKQITNQFNI